MCENLRKFKLADLSLAIIDDHEVVLEGLRSYMLKSGTGRVDTFTNANHLLDGMSTHTYDIFIVDVELPDMDATKLIDEIRQRDAKAKIIINTIHEEMWVVRKMEEKKVDGVMYKSGQLENLLQAVISVSEGKQYFCNKYKLSNKKLSLHNDTLSQREIDVLLKIADGLSTKEIAQHLYISENTVESHRQKLFAKLKAHNMADLVVKAISCGYINPKDLK